MDSKKIYRLFYSKYEIARWLNEHNEECNKNDFKWHYCGLNHDFKKEFVKESIEEYFAEDDLYLIITSGNSHYVKTSIIPSEIQKFLPKKQIGVMNKALTKMMFFQTYNGYGCFKKGVIREYPKSRVKPKGTNLKVSFHANMYEKDTKWVAEEIQKPFENLGKSLSNDYGGKIEHLWIDLELVKSHTTNKKGYSFRFQKRVTLSGFGISRKEYYYNVGHYSVVPDFEQLKTLSKESICNYLLRLIYDSTHILMKQKKKLDNFNAELFRTDFMKECHKLGYLIEER